MVHAGCPAGREAVAMVESDYRRKGSALRIGAVGRLCDALALAQVMFNRKSSISYRNIQNRVSCS